MKEFYIAKIEIYDIVREEAYYTRFKKGLNVVTSMDNHVGKSSLLKSIYYAFGANVEYDTAWDKVSKLVSVDFVLDNNIYTINRLNNKFLIMDDRKNILLKTTHVSTDLAPYLSKLFDMEIYLTNKKNEVVLAPPVYFFLPYYIDQDHGWGSEPFSSFMYLTQYTKRERLKSLYYHLNLYNNETIALTREIESLKNEKLNYTESNTKFEDLSEFINEVIHVEEIANKEEMEVELKLLKEDVIKKLEKLEDIKLHIEQLKITMSTLEYNLDIIEQESNRREESVEIKCPECGYEKCTVYNYKNKDIVVDEYAELNTEFSITELKGMISKTQEDIDIETHIYIELYNEISEKQKRVKNQDLFINYINALGIGQVKNKFEERISSNSKKIENLDSEIKKEEKELDRKQNPKKLNKKYKNEVINFLMELKAWDNRASDKITLLRPYKGQGNLAVKSIIASYLALYKVMEIYAQNTIKFSFIVDSPRSKEASESSSAEILSKISNISNLNQIIVATVDYDKYNSGVSKKVNKIFLKKSKHLLSKEKYEELANEELITLMQSIE